MMRQRRGCTLAIPIAMGERFRILSTVANMPADEFTAPAVALGPHVASLGMRFYTGAMFPQDIGNKSLLPSMAPGIGAEKIGYRITLVSRDEQGRLRYSVFAEGWLQGQKAWGRPADVLVMPDGALWFQTIRPA